MQSSGKKEVSASNVLVAIFGEKQSHAVYLLSLQDVARLDVVNFISHGLTKVGEEVGEPGDGAAVESEKESESSSNPLEQYTTNLNVMAEQGKIDPLIGREAEVERTIQILCRRRKNNPLFVGDAGVGKTALAEGLARLIVEDKVPDVLKGSTVYALDMGTLIKIFIAKVDAGDSEENEPTCTVQEAGDLTGTAVLPAEMKSPAESPTCDLTETLYDYLRFDEAIGTAPISQFTVVKVFYQHQYLTPLDSFLEGEGPDSILISSKAVF